MNVCRNFLVPKLVVWLVFNSCVFFCTSLATSLLVVAILEYRIITYVNITYCEVVCNLYFFRCHHPSSIIQLSSCHCIIQVCHPAVIILLLRSSCCHPVAIIVQQSSSSCPAVIVQKLISSCHPQATLDSKSQTPNTLMLFYFILYF